MHKYLKSSSYYYFLYSNSCIYDSDSPQNIVDYYNKLEKGYEYVFRSRFIKESKIIDCPLLKLTINRLVNLFIKTLFNIQFNDQLMHLKYIKSS